MNFLPALGGILGLFGGQDQQDPSMSEQQQRIFKLLLQRGKWREGFARSTPLSTTQEQQGLAETQGLASQGARRSREAAFAAMSPTSLQSPSVARAQSNLSAAQTAQQSNIYSQAYQQGQQRRDQARQQAYSLFGQAGNIAGSPVNPARQEQDSLSSFLPLMLQFGQQYGARNAGGGSSGAYGYATPGTQLDPTFTPRF